MKIKQTNDKGEEVEVEVSTQEEVDARLATEKAALEEGHKKAVEEKDTQLNTITKEKSDLEAKIAKMELDGVKDDHPNFKILKDALAKKDKDITDLKESVDNDKKVRKQEVLNAEVKTLAKGNEELEKKIKLHLEKTLSALPDGTAEERKIKLEAAMKLSVDVETPGMFDGGVGGGGRGGDAGGDSGAKVEFTAREKSLGSKLGITEEDYKKYGPKLGKK